jgi:hypothetical protein
VVTNHQRKESGQPRSVTTTLIALAPWRPEVLRAVETA